MTLLELLMAMVTLAVLLGWAAPALQHWIWKRQIEAVAELLLDSLRLARTQAAQLGVGVTLCPQATAATQPPQCQGDGQPDDWSRGWLVFLDRGLDGRFDSGDHLIRVEQPLMSAHLEASIRRVSFQPLGIVEYPHAGFSFSLTPTRSPHDTEAAALARRICVSKPGRARLTAAGAVSC